MTTYPWYELVDGDSLTQGDLLVRCPVFLPPEDLADKMALDAVFRWEA